jgi:3',5'-cyclic AMP phosphodiesterase CpdA
VLERLAVLSRPLDALIITGDISNTGSTADYEWLRARLGPFAAVVAVPGNHDSRPALRGVLLGQEEHAEPINTVHDIGGLTVLACDSTVPGEDAGLLTDETVNWLDEALATAGSKGPAIVAFHHPPVLLHDAYMDAMRQFEAGRLANVLRRHTRVLGILCGHAHQAVRTSFAGIPLAIAPSVAPWSRLPWEKEMTATAPPGFAVHAVTRDSGFTTHFRMVAVDVFGLS